MTAFLFRRRKTKEKTPLFWLGTPNRSYVFDNNGSYGVFDDGNKRSTVFCEHLLWITDMPVAEGYRLLLASGVQELVCCLSSGRLLSSRVTHLLRRKQHSQDPAHVLIVFFFFKIVVYTCLHYCLRLVRVFFFLVASHNFNVVYSDCNFVLLPCESRDRLARFCAARVYFSPSIKSAS